MSPTTLEVTPFTYDLGLIWNFGETWKFMFTTIFQKFISINFINERSCYFLEKNWDLNIKWFTTRFQQFQIFWDFGRHIKYMSSIYVQNFSSIDDDHKKLSLSKEIDFKTEVKTLDIWISFNTSINDMNFFSHM